MLDIRITQLFSFLVFLVLGVALQAQVVLVPAQNRIQDPKAMRAFDQAKQHQAGARETLTLPFIDDFSSPGPYPDASLWVENQVFVNTDYAVEAPSIGMASFDGLDASGSPYNKGFGPSDTLTSMPIDMTGADTNTLCFSYYLQAGGLTFRPENVDVMLVLFSADGENWEEMQRIERNMLNGANFTFFSFKPIPVHFLTDKFQFRFVNYSDNAGIRDVWNLDYVRLKHQFQADLSVETDVALTQPPSFLFRRYSRIPSRQLIGNVEKELQTGIKIGINNQFVSKLQAQNSTFSGSRQSNGQTIILEETLLEVPPISAVNQRDLDPGQHSFENPIKADIGSIAQRIESELTDQQQDGYVFMTQYAFEQASESIDKLIQNNTATRLNFVDQTYAYDDGTAEVNIGLEAASTNDRLALALAYDLNISDTIQAIQSVIPRFEDGESSKAFRLAIWGANLTDGPIFTSDELKPVYANEALEIDTLQGITNYRLRGSEGQDTFILLPAGKFHIGWLQESTTGLGATFGYDRNSTLGKEHLFYFDGSNWTGLADNSNFDGSLIMRPVLSGKYISNTSVANIPANVEEVNWYPNPSTDIIQLTHGSISEHATIYIMDAEGRIVRKSAYQPQVNLAGLSSGKYVILILDAQRNKLFKDEIIKY